MQYVVFPNDFRKFPQNIINILSKYQNSKLYPGLPIYQNQMNYFASDRAFHGL